MLELYELIQNLREFYISLRHVTEWVRLVILSNSVLLHDLGHTGCVTGPTR